MIIIEYKGNKYKIDKYKCDPKNKFPFYINIQK